jgi:NAD-dependent dihydropyrimidine dehydrogenase PreA subunit
MSHSPIKIVKKRMPEETYYGVPRSKIPWHPTIDYEKCISCGKCVDYCKLGVYEFEEKEGKNKPVVKNPNNCVVFCTGCEEQCPAGAIKFPSKKETREIIKKLQKAEA